MAFLLHRDREEERASLPGPSVDPDASTVPVDDLLADRKSDPGAGIFVAVVQALEHEEDALAVLRIEPDAVVGDREEPRAVVFAGAHVHARTLGAVELERIRDEVLEELRELALVAVHVGKRVVRDGGAASLLGAAQVRERLCEGGLARDL